MHRGVIIAGAVTDLCRRREGALQSSPVCSADSRGWLGIIAELDARTLPQALTSCCPRGLLRSVRRDAVTQTGGARTEQMSSACAETAG